MNDRQTDELLALSAIYPDTVSWTLLPPSVALPHGSVEVRVKLAVELEEEVEVEVKDWVAPLPPSPRSLAVAELGDTLEGLAVKEEPASGRKKRKRGGGGKGRGGKALAGDAAPFRLHTPSRIAPAAPAPRSAVARPAPPVPPSPTSFPPPLTSNGKTPRISFTPRPASPPPPTPSVDLSPAPVLDPAVPKRLSLQYLPPLELRVVLPPSYPDETGPVELSVTEQDETRVGWLDAERRGVVEDRCRTAHNVGEELLLDLLDLLTSPSPAFASLFSLTPPLSFTQPPPAFPPPSLTPLSTSLSTFNALSCTLIFTLRSHPCPLCFTPVSGTRCIALQSCGHVFCRACLTSYFGVLIGEGLVRSVACPDVGCVKERAMEEREGGGRGAEEVERTGAVSREEVESLCGEEKAVRWEWLREKVRVESDPTIAFCPISSCQSPVPKLEDEEKLRVCPKCSFSFCMFCRLTWHGTRNPCALPQSSAIVNAYVRGDALTRAGLELRYGAAVLKRLVEANEEEKALEKWLSENATRCPGCDTPIEKSAGCNHVECYRCKSHLCFRCGKSIPPSDPYKHFSTPGLGCYGRLFDFTPGNEPAVEEWIGEFLDDDEAGGH